MGDQQRCADGLKQVMRAHDVEALIFHRCAGLLVGGARGWPSLVPPAQVAPTAVNPAIWRDVPLAR